jgi:mRNA interferase YafQ
MKLIVYYTNQFRKDFKLCIKRGYDMQLIKKIMNALENGELLPPQNKDHPLLGNYLGFHECHIQPDWLLVYQSNMETLIFDRTGTHSDLF